MHSSSILYLTCVETHQTFELFIYSKNFQSIGMMALIVKLNSRTVIIARFFVWNKKKCDKLLQSYKVIITKL